MSGASPARPARRRGTRAQRRPGPTRGATAGGGVVLLALAAVLLTGPGDAAPGSAAQKERPSGTLVDATLLGCPDLAPPAGDSASVRLGLAPRDVDGGLGTGGPVQAGPVTTTATTAGTAGTAGTASGGDDVRLERGALTASRPPSGSGRVQATGDPAAGLFGFRSDTGDQRLAIARCPAPRAQWWFTGAGAGLDHRSTLVLTNLDPGPAVVDLEVLGPDGPVQTVGTQGLTIAAGARKAIPVSDIAPQTEDLALAVHADRGRVVAAVDDQWAESATAPSGREWLTGVDRPSRVVRLAGLPAARGLRQDLFVANPGDREAVVEVRVAGRSGSFTPTGLDPLTVAPGTVARVSVGVALPDAEAVAVRLSATVPVVAGLRSSTARADHTLAAPVSPLTGPAVAPLPRGADATLQLTAGARAAKVDVAAYDEGGEQVEKATVAVPATATATWTPKQPRARYLLVSPPAGSAVVGAVAYAGAGRATVPLVPLPLRLVEPVVRPATR